MMRSFRLIVLDSLVDERTGVHHLVSGDGVLVAAVEHDRRTEVFLLQLGDDLLQLPTLRAVDDQVAPGAGVGTFPVDADEVLDLADLQLDIRDAQAQDHVGDDRHGLGLETLVRAELEAQLKVNHDTLLIFAFTGCL